MLDKLFKPVSIGTMVYLRIIFGITMMVEVYRYWSKGWIYTTYIRPEFTFSFFDWDILQPLPGNGMYFVFALIGILGFNITIGFMYRISIILFTFAFSYIFFLSKAHYLNHFYFVILVAIAMSICSPHRFFSVDAKIWPKLKSTKIEQWQPWLICFTMGVVYFYGGIAKINPDWLNGNPLYFWNFHRAEVFQDLRVGIFMAWFGMLYDLLVAFALCYRKTRLVATIACAAFHMTNAYAFNIGIFPWLSLGLTFMYWPADWPFKMFKFPHRNESHPPIPLNRRKAITVFLALFVGYNMLMPWRHHLAEGNVFWNEVGHRYSWRMKLRSKRAKYLRFEVVDNQTKKSWKVKPRKHLSKKQVRKMGGRPDMIIQFAHYLKEVYLPRSSGDLSVYVDHKVSFNYRSYRRCIKRDADLLKVEACLFCDLSWIWPFNAGQQRTFADSAKLVQRIINKEIDY